MKVDRMCDVVREELSARLDDEANASKMEAVDDHLAECEECRAYEERLWKVRRAVRAQAVDPVPDLSGSIMERIEQDRRLEVPRLRRERVRYAIVGAAAAIALLVATSLPWSDRSDTATAGELVAGVRAAARVIDSYQATFSATEFGWLGAVPERHFEIDLSYVAPERVAMRTRDLTEYPSAIWPRNDVTLVSDGSTLLSREPVTCPRLALPECTPGTAETRVIQNRQPFDGVHSVPTDAILPLTALAGSEGLETRGAADMLNRRAHSVILPVRQALPLLESFRAGGSWRDFHPADPVEVWLDASTWFPLGLDVRASGSAERSEWAVRNSYRDRPGELLLRVRATALSETLPPASTFAVRPANDARDGGFRETAFGALDPRLLPGNTRGLTPYRAGRSGRSTIAVWTRGMSYLKLVEQPVAGAAEELTAEEVRLPGTGPAYYIPATESDPRRVTFFVGGRELRLESNLQRADLLRAAASIPVRSRHAALNKMEGAHITRALRIAPERLHNIEIAAEPGYMPPGYAPRVALMLYGPDERRTLTVYYRRAEAEVGGLGIRIARISQTNRLVPSSEDLISTTIRPGVEGRWSVQRGTLEWIEDGVLTAITAPEFDRATVVRIARSLQ